MFYDIRKIFVRLEDDWSTFVMHSEDVLGKDVRQTIMCRPLVILGPFMEHTWATQTVAPRT